MARRRREKDRRPQAKVVRRTAMGEADLIIWMKATER